MSYPFIAPHSPEQPKKERLSKWFKWWHKIPTPRQDRLIALTPLLALFVFIAFLLLTYNYLTNEQKNRERINTEQSIATIEQQMRLVLVDNEDLLQDIAIKISLAKENQEELFKNKATLFIEEHSEITALYWHDVESGEIYLYSNTGRKVISNKIRNLEILEDARAPSSAVGLGYGKLIFSYTPPFPATPEISLMYASAALPGKLEPKYVITATYDLDRLLRKIVPADMALHTSVWLQNKQGDVIASTSPQFYEAGNRLDLEDKTIIRSKISRFDDHLNIYAQGNHALKSLTANFLFWFTAFLCIFISMLLLLNWRHIRQLVAAQNAAQRETNFRRAVENSVTTGLQGFDSEGKIIYVNPAFCQMVGYQESELIGCDPPFPYWPEDTHHEFMKTMNNLGRSILRSTGREVQLQRRNGALFFAKLYISPLIDAKGQQNGWITAVTDISESKRSREELALAGQRFTTVLGGMDAAISVAAVGAKHLVYTNNAYRNIFGDNEEGHHMLAAKAKHFHPAPDLIDLTEEIGVNEDGFDTQKKKDLEIYLDSQDRWIEVRSQYLPWVDGRLAQMLIATDITERKKTEEQAAIQADQAEAASRLITMGEMASSVAHELNQPLTAINNYCSGLIHRVKSNSLTQEELLVALEKTAKQAERAGMITQRIRSFVKKNEPNRLLSSVTEIIDNIYELIEIDSRRRNIKLNIDIEKDLPPIVMDPLLIEQVILNLTRNAVESISDAKRPPEKRSLKVEIKRLTLPDEERKVEFSVLDSGLGMPEEVLEHMFEAFFTTKSNGLGIGLNLCRSIIESHGGHLYFDNIYTKETLLGCRFAFTLPMDVQI